MLENELKHIEEQYKLTREKVNRLREDHERCKQRTKEIYTESKEFSEYIENKREKRYVNFISIQFYSASFTVRTALGQAYSHFFGAFLTLGHETFSKYVFYA